MFYNDIDDDNYSNDDILYSDICEFCSFYNKPYYSHLNYGFNYEDNLQKNNITNLKK